MDRTLGFFSLSTLVLVLVSAAMVTSTTGSTAAAGPDGAAKIAQGFIVNEPTFKFDGMKDTLSINVTGTYPDPGMYEVTGSFTSAHGGFGDRDGVIVTQALTPHVCRIIVSDGQVESALMDGMYDMVSQKQIQ